jgi:hypothetical protein
LVCACAQILVSSPASTAAIAIFFVIILGMDLQIWPPASVLAHWGGNRVRPDRAH